MTDSSLRRDQKPNAQGFDEIRIVTVPRFKDSGLSGSEWRISTTTQFLRNGVVVHETGARDVETAAHLLSYHLLEAYDHGKGYFAGEGDICDQEGCSNKATVSLEKIKEGCGKCGTVKVPEYSRPFRKFCDAHKRRGDSDLDDQDDCYKPITLPERHRQ
jgi:hypothetical protein